MHRIYYYINIDDFPTTNRKDRDTERQQDGSTASYHDYYY